jgi:hypothetical protein
LSLIFINQLDNGIMLYLLCSLFIKKPLCALPTAKLILPATPSLASFAQKTSLPAQYHLYFCVISTFNNFLHYDLFCIFFRMGMAGTVLHHRPCHASGQPYTLQRAAFEAKPPAIGSGGGIDYSLPETFRVLFCSGQQGIDGNNHVSCPWIGIRGYGIEKQED